MTTDERIWGPAFLQMNETNEENLLRVAQENGVGEGLELSDLDRAAGKTVRIFAVKKLSELNCET